MKRLVLLVALAGCGKQAEEPAPAEHHEDRHEPMAAQPTLSLAVKVDGKATTWSKDVFDRVPHFATANKDGEARDTWSLRELVHREVGPNARVTAVVGKTTKAIDAAAWGDATKTPIIHVTRRGQLKFRWADGSGAWGETEVQDVTGVEISP